MLQNCKIALFFLMLSPIVLGAVNNPILGSSEGCSVARVPVAKSFKTVLKCGSFNYEVQQEFLDSKFLKWATVKTKNDTLVILFFTKGVHGEKAEVFSLKKKLKIKTIASSWPIEINKEKLEFKLDSNKKGEYPSHFLSFKDL